MPPWTGILVHISGPSRGSDDARYRREVRNCLQFETRTRHVLLSIDKHEDGTDGKDELDEVDSESQKCTESDYGDSDFSQLETPGPRTMSIALPVSEKSKRSSLQRSGHVVWRTAANSAPGTAPVKGALPTVQVYGTPIIHVACTPNGPRPHTAPATMNSSQETPSIRSTHSDSWGPGAHEVPDSQVSPPNLKRPLESSSPSPPYRSTSRSPKRHRKRSASPVEQHLQIQQSLSSQGKNPKSLRSSPPPIIPDPAPDPLQVPCSPMAIWPRRPITDTVGFESHMTPALEIIVRHLPLATFFSPYQLRPATRSLRTLERGHWRLPVASFTPDLKIKAWSYLKQFVGEDRAGWGVWCVIEDEPSTDTPLNTNNENEVRENVDQTQVIEQQTNKSSSRSAGNNKQPTAVASTSQSIKRPVLTQQIWKIYCWGELAPAIWLLLFMATNRKIKGCGAAWLDAVEETVVLMR